jgi:hypothetical protein
MDSALNLRSLLCEKCVILTGTGNFLLFNLQQQKLVKFL